MTKIIKLANGITVLTEQRAGTGKVSMGVFIKSGSMHESAADNGLTNLMQESTQGGTTTRSHDEIFAEIESAGGSLTSLTSADGTMFSTEVIGRKAGDTFAVLADVLRNPVFDSGEIDQARDQIKQIITQSGQSPGSVARKLFAKTVFGGASIGNDPAGTPALLDTFTPEQVKQKHAELLSNPSNIFISFAGDIDDATAEKLANDYFGDIPANPAGATKNPSYIFEGGDVRQTAALDQLNFMLAFEAPNGKDSDRFAAMMLKETLAGGMSRPLFQEIREKRGLVYTVGAGYTRSDDTGYFVIVGGAGKGNAGELVSVTMDLFGQVARDGFPQRDLDEARERILRRLNSNLETASGTATSNLAEIVDKGRVTPLAEFEANLKKVTPDDLKRVAYNMLNAGKLGLSAVGPLDTLPPEQDIKDMMKAQVGSTTRSQRSGANG